MTRGEIRLRVRDDIGEPREGRWKDEEINRHIQRSANRHAREALSVERTRYSTSVAGVQEYIFPPEFGQLISVQFRRQGQDNHIPLTYMPKDQLRRFGRDINYAGTPAYYFVYDKGVGLYPVPNVAPLFQYTFPDVCSWFVPRQNLNSPTNLYETQITLQLRPGDDDPHGYCSAYISHLSLHLRRYGYPFRGKLQMAFYTGSDFSHRFDSGVIYAENVSTVPDWYHFDFSNNPIEITSTVQTYALVLYADTEYMLHLQNEPGVVGVQIGADRQNDHLAYFQLHELKNDIAIDFWANTCREMVTDDDVPEVREDYHDTLIEITDALCFRKAGINPQMAQMHEAKAQGEINQARTNQLQRTQGERVTPDAVGDYDDVLLDYNESSDSFVLNLF